MVSESRVTLTILGASRGEIRRCLFPRHAYFQMLVVRIARFEIASVHSIPIARLEPHKYRRDKDQKQRFRSVQQACRPRSALVFADWRSNKLCWLRLSQCDFQEDHCCSPIGGHKGPPKVLQKQLKYNTVFVLAFPAGSKKSGSPHPFLEGLGCAIWQAMQLSKPAPNLWWEKACISAVKSSNPATVLSSSPYFILFPALCLIGCLGSYPATSSDDS